MWDIVHGKLFNDVILYTIVMNTVVMASNQYQMNIYMRRLFKVLNYIFAIIFNFEMISKLIALEF